METIEETVRPAPSRPAATATGEDRGDAAAARAVATALGGLLKRHHGRGPTRVSVQVTRETVLVLFFDALTPIERSLRDTGRGVAVDAQREAAGRVLRHEMERLVGDAVGRHVLTSMGARRLDPEICAEVFVLAP